jgi:superfamily II DNA helicase RecQ
MIHPLPQILSTVRRYWGFDSLRPLQEQAIRAGLEQRDSLVVMPTGGGKSLCYQVPPELAQRTDVVVSPLISLMKDQVDCASAAIRRWRCTVALHGRRYAKLSARSPPAPFG